MSREMPSFGKTLFRGAVAVGLLIGTPVFLCTDTCMTWMCDRSIAGQWSTAPEVVYRCATIYRWTGRLERGAQEYERFIEQWPEAPCVPDAVYHAAVSLREHADNLDYTAQGNEERVIRKQELREKAVAWFEWFYENRPDDPRAEVARRAAYSIRRGY